MRKRTCLGVAMTPFFVALQAVFNRYNETIFQVKKGERFMKLVQRQTGRVYDVVKVNLTEESQRVCSIEAVSGKNYLKVDLNYLNQIELFLTEYQLKGEEALC